MWLEKYKIEKNSKMRQAKRKSWKMRAATVFDLIWDSYKKIW